MTALESELSSGPLDDATLGLLVRLDEALRSGKDPSESLNVSLPNIDGLLEAELVAAALCLFELEATFPRALKSSSRSSPTVQLPQKIGRFEIESQIGTGGFGVVYRGRDPELNRLVAIKVPRHHAFTEPTLRRRFVREAYAAAQLDHPHIVPIYEAGEYEAGAITNLPYIALAYCEGPTLSRCCVEQPELMSPRTAASLVLQLVKAIQYCHSRGILHRDIKPSNVLLFPCPDGSAGFPFTPKLTDLGLAKLLKSEHDETASAFLVGTPTFMSPEQAQGASVGPTSDVYSLGATLYFTLTGRPPFVAVQLTDLLKQLVECEAIEPKTLNIAVDKDLNTICMKCLEKNPGRRYTSASAMADDLERYLAGLPICARPISKLLRLGRWCQRKPTVALLATCVCLLAIGLLVTLSFNSYRLSMLGHQLAERNEELSRTITELDESLKFANLQQQAARDSERKTLQLLYVTDVQAANEAWNNRDFSSAARLLNAHSDTLELREFSGRYLNARLSAMRSSNLNLGAQIWNIAQDHSGRTLAISDAKGFVHVVANGEQLTKKFTWDTGQREVNCAAYSPDDQVLATAGDDGRVGLWNATTGQLIDMLNAFERPVFGVAFADQGRLLVACGNTPEILVWELKTRKLLQRKTTAHTRGIESISVSPDGQHVATVGHDGAMRVHSIHGLSTLLEKSVDSKLAMVQYDPSGQYAVVADLVGWLRVWDAKTGVACYSYKAPDPIRALTINASGDIYLTDGGGVIYRIDASVYRSPNTPTTIESEIRVSVFDDRRIAGLVVTQDGTSLVTGNSKGQLERVSTLVGRARSQLPERQLELPTKISTGQPHAQWLRARDKTLECWNLTTGKMESRCHYDRDLSSCLLSRLSNTVVLGNKSGEVAQFSANVSEQILWHKIFDGQEIHQVNTFGHGSYIVALSSRRDLAILDWRKLKQVAFFPNQGFFDISPDERWLACGKSGTNNLDIVDLRTFERVTSKVAHSSSIWDIKFSFDGTRLLTCSGDRTAKVWTTHDWNCQSSLIGHTTTVLSGSISPDNQTIATLDEAGKILLWYLASAQKLGEIATPGPSADHLMFSHDGKSLAVDQEEGQVYVFRAD